jgi:N6-L-threonylcarbamoyladenine synthase
MIVLGIETSCDESAVALIRYNANGSHELLGELISSQNNIHEQYGGVVPEFASREHLRNLPLLYDSLLSKCNLSLNEIDLIGVTQGPGLKGCLLIGLSFAQGLSQASGKPIVGVNHIEGHLLAPRLDNPDLKFPYLCLIVSGGHTEILEVRGVGDYELIARTQDDAAGEAFDKSANLLSLPYPGGARLAALADSVPTSRFKLPKVMREQAGFSFSGLKTAFLLLTKKHEQELLAPDIRAELAHVVQGAIVDTLLFKTKEALKERGLKQVAVSGGVAANKKLREEISKIRGVQGFFPSGMHSTDNAAMIAYVAGERYRAGIISNDLSAQARWPVEMCSVKRAG